MVDRGMKEFFGVVMVTLVSACDLPRVGKDVQCMLTLGAQSVSSRKLTHTQNPIWNETLMLSWDKVDTLTIRVLHSHSRNMHSFRKAAKEELLCDTFWDA